MLVPGHSPQMLGGTLNSLKNLVELLLICSIHSNFISLDFLAEAC
jgi:hypothetical protein